MDESYFRLNYQVVHSLLNYLFFETHCLPQLLYQFIPLHVIWCQVSTVCHNVIVSGCDCALSHMLTDEEEVIPLKGKKISINHFKCYNVQYISAER